MIYKFILEVSFMKAIVDRNTCVGCGLCADLCPAVFSMDDEGVSVPISEDISAENTSDAEQAMEQCPVAAITIE